MKALRYLLLGALLCSAPLQAQTLDANHSVVSLLTANAGEELYAAFGHSAVRVRDTVSGTDAVFNYGMFNFNDENFYINFARGRMRYCLGVQRFEHFMAIYGSEGREVREQVFRLDSTQRTFMVHFLLNNAREENRYYRYHFFLDNCATRIRDLVMLTWPELELPAATSHPSFRQLVYDYTTEHLWGRFGIDIALGWPTDMRTDTREQMFLPDYLSSVLAAARNDGKPIMDKAQAIVIPEKPLVVTDSWFTPMWMGCIVLLLAFMCSFVPRMAKAFDFTLFFTAGLIGFLVVFLWFFTDHTNTHGNLNILWAWPTHVIAAFALLRKRRGKLSRRYFRAVALVSLLLLIAWAFLPQHLNAALIPVVIAIGWRGLKNGRDGQSKA